MTCSHCGSANEQDARFCGNCGVGLATASPGPSGPVAPLPLTDRVICARCGASNEAGGAYCRRCGTALAESPGLTRPPGGAVPPAQKGTSAAWWLLPLLLTWVGGLIGYLVVRESDARKARRLLWFGLGMTAFWIVAYVVTALLSFTFLASPIPTGWVWGLA